MRLERLKKSGKRHRYTQRISCVLQLPNSFVKSRSVRRSERFEGELLNAEGAMNNYSVLIDLGPNAISR